MDSSESEEEEEFHVCCANEFCVFGEQTIHDVEEAHECIVCQLMCHIDCANEVADAVDESLAFACKECHANIH